MKASELSGYWLNYWVAKAEGKPLSSECDASGTDAVLIGTGAGDLEPYDPASDWADGGPIIERDQIFLQPPSTVHYNGGPNHGWKVYEHWRATVSSRTRTLPPSSELAKAAGIGGVGRGAGETPLIAAMRAKVASHYGDEVPDEAA
jgi:hypothetical protein